MKDEFGFPICYNDIRRRPDIKNNTKHELFPLSVARPTNWPDAKSPHLCPICRCFVDEEGEFLNTI